MKKVNNEGPIMIRRKRQRKTQKGKLDVLKLVLAFGRGLGFVQSKAYLFWDSSK